MNERIPRCGFGLAYVFLFAIGCCLIGCGESDPQEKKTENIPAQAVVPPAGDKIACEPVRQQLIGSWLGVAYIDEAKLAEKLMELDATKREVMLQRAEHFMGTTMAYQFNSDGSMTNEVEIIPPAGLPILDSVRGQWEVVAAEGMRFQLRNTEESTDGTLANVSRNFQFYEGQNSMGLEVALGEVLGECNPLIVFERKTPGVERTATATEAELK